MALSRGGEEPDLAAIVAMGGVRAAPSRFRLHRDADFVAMIRAFLLTILLAAVVAGLSCPVCEWLLGRLRGRTAVAAVANRHVTDPDAGAVRTTPWAELRRRPRRILPAARAYWRKIRPAFLTFLPSRTAAIKASIHSTGAFRATYHPRTRFRSTFV